MPDSSLRPLVLVRGFGGLDVAAEQRNAYQGYNDGTVYPGRRGDNYIYEGFLLRAMKSDRFRYTDATNVVGFYADKVTPPPELHGYDADDAAGYVAIDPGIANRVLSENASGTIWVYRFYDLKPRGLENYGAGLRRLVQLIKKSVEKHAPGTFSGVDIVAHSMGGLVVREALLAMHKAEPGSAPTLVNRVVTLGTPHRGIAFQRLPGWLLQALPMSKEGSNELKSFSPESDRFLELEKKKAFPVHRILTVVGTNYRAYGVPGSSLANRLSTLIDEGSLMTNRSDGLVKQSAAQLPGAPRTFVNKCHGGVDSLVTSREAYEITMRFLHGTHRVQLWLEKAKIERGGDWFGDSEFYFGVTIKPRFVDFELFHQSVEAENCYGPFKDKELTDGPPDLEGELRKKLAERGDATCGWAGPDRLIWEGWVDHRVRSDESVKGMVFRLDIYVGERDTRGVGFSDNVIFRKQYYVQAFPDSGPKLFVHTGEEYLGARDSKSEEELEALAEQFADKGVAAPVRKLERGPGGDWQFGIGGTGFKGVFRVAIGAADPAD